MSVKDADKSKPYFPPAGAATDGTSDSTHATATCFCGTVQLRFAIEGVSEPFVCHCTDCHKIHSSVLGANFVVEDKHLEHVRGKEALKTYSMSKTIGTPGATMTNHFCSNCGGLMYRVGTSFPGMSILRMGTVDDFNLMDTLFQPKIEQYTKDRVSWLGDVKGAKQVEGSHYQGKPRM